MSNVRLWVRSALPRGKASVIARLVVLALSLTPLLIGTGRAATETWSGTAGTAWSAGGVSGNWTGSAVPASGDIAEFNTTFSNQPTIGSTATSAGAVWGATGLGQNVLISGTATLTLNDATVHSLATTDILLDDTGNHSLEIDASVAIANQSSITVNNTATLTLGASAGSANLAIAATDTLTFTGSGGVILVNDNVTSTSGAITVNTTGAAVKLTGSNSNTGATTLTAGTLDINSNGALGTGTLNLNGGTIDNTSGGAITTPNNNPNIVIGGNFAFGGSNSLNLGTGAVTITGSRTITLGTGSGTVLTFGGVASNASAAAGIITTVNSNASAPATPESVVFTGFNLETAGTTAATDSFTGSGNIAINGAVGNGSVSVNNGLTYAGTATLTLEGSSASTYLGTTTLKSGEIAIANGSSATLGATTAALAVAGGTLDLGGTTQTVGAVTVTQASTIQDGTLSGASYSVTNPSGNATISATLAGNGLVTMTGAGNLILSASNTFSGGLTEGAASGTLELNTAGAINSGTLTLNGASFTEVTNGISGSTVVAIGGTPTINASNNYTGSTTLAGTLTLGAAGALGTGEVYIKNGTIEANTPLTGTSAIQNFVDFIGSSNSLGTIGGSSNIEFAGGMEFHSSATRTLTLTNTAVTTFSTGTVLLSDSTAANAVSFYDTSGGNLDISANIANGASPTTSASSVIWQGSSTNTLVLTGANTYTGTTTVDVGTMELAGNGSLLTSTLTVASGATPVVGASGNATLLVNGNYTIGASTVVSKLILNGGNTGGSPIGQGTLNMVDGTTNTLTLANNSNADILTIGSTTNGNNAILDMEVGAQSDEIAVGSGTGKVLLYSGATAGTTANVVNITSLGNLSGTTQTLIAGKLDTTTTGNSTVAQAFTLGTTSGNFGGYTLALGAGNGTTTVLLLTETADTATPSSGTVYWYGGAAAASGGTTAWNSFENGNTNTSNFSNNTAATSLTNVTQLLGASSDVVFDATSGTLTSAASTTLGQNFTIDSLAFNTAGVSIASGGAGTNTLTINTATNSATYGINVTAPSGSSDTITAPLALGNTQSWSVASSDTLTVSGQVSGSSYGLTSAGAGVLVLSGSNTYGGGTTVSAGTLYANNSGGSATGSGVVNVGASGTLAGTGFIAPTVSSGTAVIVANNGNITPGGVQPAAIFSYSANGNNGPSNPGNGNLTLSPGGVSGSAFLLGVGTGSVTNPSLTFALGNTVTGSGPYTVTHSDSEIVVSGSTANKINFNAGGSGSTSSVVSINDLVGASLQLDSLYVLVQGNGSTTFDDNGTAWSLAAYTGPVSNPNGNTLELITSSTAGLSLLPANTNGNFFSNWYGGSVLIYDVTTDSIDVEVVPEPGTWAMMLGGLSALLFWQRRRKS